MPQEGSGRRAEQKPPTSINGGGGQLLGTSPQAWYAVLPVREKRKTESPDH